ncbi:8-oxo-dGTP pyrophosphatase MutT (NUDIX family) [Chromobacterium alkanivorans]|uniref:hypothetical protein n=1 Tax=Chromobacterium TaxID=535 RepID=UPI00065415F5|nr:MULTISPECIES: hypothetical protein [Chromobacterium]KMN82708.1 hypothetical protein VK98_06620 [Chromobacterium sp. LK11]MCS3804590.1 8-oxo-dGTP pyrophosphatase MutT (NUDIX family) [Chromobacterium alkanivorans]MCS3818929.1 8-oxo-dGTP pyrophosphatase MutT (NUDIX family) [Chromobacterium alkanivorans]MCS3873213.1 8-oxo-dGTP pyrophosphatase MutT (NUDIX family) [Chromobacterium alkanivorans]
MPAVKLRYCNLEAIWNGLNPHIPLPFAQFRFIQPGGGGDNGVLSAHVDANGGYLFDARSNLGGAASRVYGVISANNGCGLYVPIGKQSVTPMLALHPVPICVGGGRDMRITAGGLVNETDLEVIAREAAEELGEPLHILSSSPLATIRSGGHANYHLLRLSRELSRLYYAWDVNGSDQVTAVRYWAAPSLLERPHGGNLPADGLAEQLFDDMGCADAHRDAWLREWHAEAYGEAIRTLLNQSVRLYSDAEGYYILSRWIGNRRYVYRDQYAPYPPEVTRAHEAGCNGQCRQRLQALLFPPPVVVHPPVVARAPGGGASSSTWRGGASSSSNWRSGAGTSSSTNNSSGSRSDAKSWRRKDE